MSGSILALALQGLGISRLQVFAPWWLNVDNIVTTGRAVTVLPIFTEWSFAVVHCGWVTLKNGLIGRG